MTNKKNHIPQKRPTIALLDLKIKKAEANIRKMEVSFKHKYQALENFLTLLVNFASHDIKNTIHTLDGMVSTIDVEHVTIDDIDSIKLNIDHMRSTLKKFSDLNIQSHVNSFDLSKLMGSLEILHRPFMDSDKIKFSVKYTPEELRKMSLQHDFHSILYMFNNLMINSMTALAGMPNPTIDIDISISENNENIIFLFSDNGHGIKKENRDKIFTPYFTTKPEGTGVGLTHVKYVLDTMSSGNIRLLDETIENTFTTFEIIIPIEDKNETQDIDN